MGLKSKPSLFEKNSKGYSQTSKVSMKGIKIKTFAVKKNSKGYSQTSKV
jgi:hypothetical protein